MNDCVSFQPPLDCSTLWHWRGSERVRACVCRCHLPWFPSGYVRPCSVTGGARLCATWLLHVVLSSYSAHVSVAMMFAHALRLFLPVMDILRKQWLFFVTLNQMKKWPYLPFGALFTLKHVLFFYQSKKSSNPSVWPSLLIFLAFWLRVSKSPSMLSVVNGLASCFKAAIAECTILTAKIYIYTGILKLIVHMSSRHGMTQCKQKVEIIRKIVSPVFSIW